MTPEELAAALDGLPESDLLRAFSDAMERKTAAQLDEDDLAMIRLTTPSALDPLSEEDRANYEALFGPGSGGPAA